MVGCAFHVFTDKAGCVCSPNSFVLYFQKFQLKMCAVTDSCTTGMCLFMPTVGQRDCASHTRFTWEKSRQPCVNRTRDLLTCSAPHVLQAHHFCAHLSIIYHILISNFSVILNLFGNGLVNENL